MQPSIAVIDGSISEGAHCMPVLCQGKDVGNVLPPTSATVPNSAAPSDTHATPGCIVPSAEREAAAQELLRSVRERRSERQLLANTNKLLVQREHRATATLRDVRDRGVARQPVPPTQDPSLSGGLVSPEAGRLTARVQQRLFASGDDPVLGMASFKAHCSITVDALVRMQGGTGCELDLSQQNLRLVIDDYRARVAASIGVARDDVCWHYTCSRQMAPGVPLSMGLGLTTAPCAASLFVLYFLFQLEAALLLEEGDVLETAQCVDEVASADGAGASGGVAAGTAQGASELMADADLRRSGSVNIVKPAQLPSSPRDACAPRPASATMERAVLRSCDCSSELPANSTPDVQESAAGNPEEARQAAAQRAASCCASARAPELASGEADTVDWHAVEAFAESCGSHGDFLSETLRDGEFFLGTVDRDEEEERGRVRTGLASSMPLRPAVDGAVAAMVRRYEPRMPRHRLLAPLQRFVSALRSDLPAEEPTGADVAPAGSPGEEAPADPALAALQAHHIEGSLSVMAAMHDAVDSTVKAIKQEGDRLWSASGEAHARDLASARRHAQDFVVATIALTAYAQRSYFSMALSLVVPDAFCHVENMHVRLYRHLRLPPSQKLELAHLFTDWVANRRMLTHRQTDAMLPLSIWSPHAGDGPLDFGTVVAACAQGDPAFRLRKLPESARVLHTPVAGRLVPVLQGAGSRDTAETLPLRRFYAEDGRLLLDSPAAWVMSKEMAAAAPGLVGQCSVATIAAAETLRRLRSVHDLTNNLYQDLQSRLMPGDALTVQQVMLCMWCPVLHGVGPPDIVLLCQLAHQQQRRDETFAGIEALAV